MKIAARIDPERQRYYTRQGWWGTRTLLDHWNETVQQYGDRRYVCGDNGVWLTYRQVDDYAGRLAAYLRENGVECGDVAAIQLPNWSAYCVAYVAGLKAGAVLHLISRNTEKSELADLLTRSGAKALICPTSFRGLDYEAMLSNFRRDIPSLRCVVLADELEPARSGHATLTQVLKTCRPLDTSPEVDSNDVAALLNTSGTTESPKIVMITHNNILFSETQFNRELGVTEDDIMFMPAPLHHATGFHHGLIAPMLTGAGVVLQQRFQREQAVRLILREQCTYSMGATPFVYDILQEMERTGVRLPSMKFFLCGGAHVPRSLVRRGMDLGLPICEVYGSTESPPHAFVPVAEAEKLAGSISGRPMGGVEMRLVDDNGRDVPPGVKGEEWSRGPNVFVGYLGDQAATDQVLHADGWFASGDLCVGDEAGNLRVVGRKKEIIIRGGENLSIHRIRETLEGCPGVADCAVVGKPDPRFGERICACVVPEEGRTVTLQDLLGYVSANHVPKYLWPEMVEIVDAIPRTESGKIKCCSLLQEIQARGREEANDR